MDVLQRQSYPKVILLALVFCLVGLTNGFGQTKQEALEADELLTKGRELYGERKYQAALESLEKARREYERRGERSFGAVNVLTWISACQLKLGRHEKAVTACEKCVHEMRALHKGRDHEQVARSLESLAECLHCVNQDDRAIKKYEEAIWIWRRLFPDGHEAFAELLAKTGSCLEDLGQRERAARAHQWAVSMRRRLEMDEDESQARTLNYLGNCLDDLDQSDEALMRYEEALEIYIRLFGNRHRRVAVTLMNLGYCLESLDRAEEALAKFTHALEIRRQYEDDEPEAAARASAAVASCLQDLGRHDEALAHHSRTVNLWWKVRNPAKIAASLINWARCLEYLGRDREALPHLEEVLAIRKGLHETDHQDLASALNNLGLCLDRIGRHEEALEHLDASLKMRQCLYRGDHVALSIGLNNLGSCLDGLGRHREALEHLEKALAMRKRLFPEVNAFVATSLHNVAKCLLNLGRESEALTMAEDSLRMRGSLFPGDHVAVARCLSTVGRSLCDLGRHDEALARFDQAIKMYRRLFAHDHPEKAITLSHLASCLFEANRTRDALRNYELSLAMRGRLFGTESLKTTSTLLGLADCLVSLGRYRAALEKAETALRIRIHLHPDKHPAVARSLHKVAWIQRRFGRYEEALAGARKALAMRRQIFGDDHLDIAASTGLVGECLEGLGRLPEAVEWYDAALKMYERLPLDRNHKWMSKALNDKGLCLMRLGRPLEALPVLRRSEAMTRLLRKSDRKELALGLSNLATCLLELGRHEEAMKKLHEAIKFHEEAFADDRDNPSAALIMNNVGQIFHLAGKNADAQEAFRWALAKLQSFYGSEHPRITKVMSNVATCLSDLGRHKEAARVYRKALRIARTSKATTKHILAANAAHMYLKDLNDPEKAVEMYREAISEIEFFRTQGRMLGRWERGAFLGRLTRGGPFSGMVRAQMKMNRGAEALRYLERGRARTLLDLLHRNCFDAIGRTKRKAQARGDAKQVAEADAVRSALQETDVSIRSLDTAMASAPKEEIAPLLRERSKLYEVREKLFLRRLDLTRHELKMASPREPAAIQRLLSKGEFMLAFSLTTEDGLLLVVPPWGSDIRGHRLHWPGKKPGKKGRPVTHGSVRTAVEEYVSSIVTEGRLTRKRSNRGNLFPREEERFKKTSLKVGVAGNRLFRALIPDPVWRKIRRAKCVYVLPHGGLHRLPFEALVVAPPEGGSKRTYWLDEGPEIIYGSSGSALAWSKKRRDEQGGTTLRYEVLALGDPLFQPDDRGRPDKKKQTGNRSVDLDLDRIGRRVMLSRHGRLKRLPGSGEEVRSIYRTYTGEEYRPEAIKVGAPVKLLMQKNATKSSLFKLAPSARILHLATHGLADESDWTNYSSLALAPSEDGDGFLTLIELFEKWQDRLQNCELVVLSACMTRRGPLQKDEGVFALPWGFQYAGCPSIIASLWRVSDPSTAVLMGKFYERLKAGDAKLSAFNEARKAMRKGHPQPYYWAPFIYIGDPR